MLSARTERIQPRTQSASRTTSPTVVFAIVSMGVMLATVDQFIVNIAFTAIGQGLHGSVSTVSWVLNGYSIVFAALIVPAGRLADVAATRQVSSLGSPFSPGHPQPARCLPTSGS